MNRIEKRKNKVAQKKKDWQQQKPLILEQQRLKKEKNSLKKKKEKLTTTKFLMFFLFISCSAIEAFTLYITFRTLELGMVDLSALQMLITAVVGQVVAFAIYSLKSLKENTKGGIVYDSAMIFNNNQENMNNQNQDQEEQFK